ncbi:MAG: hypothetical protein BRC23_00325 [Parcubacteria group bacterium SW_4_49_11]|jgi:hypothetical protein|nr:MAG: hypothetical protein BRC23_00325 [Parcubacteria group bacterium SW_4_49_11]
MFKGLQRKFPEQQDFIAKFAIAAKIIATYATIAVVTAVVLIQIIGWALSRFVFSYFTQSALQGGGLQ